MTESVDIDLGEVLAEALGLVVRFDYEFGPTREVVIDTVYGWTLDAPEYIRGADSLSGEYRTFRADRIVRLHGSERVDQIPWFLGQMIKLKLGMGLNRPPRLFSIKQPILLEMIEHDGTSRRYMGEITGAEFRYRETGACLTLQVTGKPEDGSKRRSSFRVHLGPGGYGRELVEIWDGDGEAIPDIMAWLDTKSE